MPYSDVICFVTEGCVKRQFDYETIMVILSIKKLNKYQEKSPLKSKWIRNRALYTSDASKPVTGIYIREAMR